MSKEIEAFDVAGRLLHVGDQVAIASTAGKATEMVVTTVEAVRAKTVILKHPTAWGAQTSRRHSAVCKIPELAGKEV
ncbi:hypothetical protein FDH93_gp123 [Pseudomonas phage vB_PaeM_G1]|uniref:Uncharacterized protein n=1 Tax=Pseudomonas phage vB_PaeM_G1 TaxID=1983539 RepID=A0A218L432_9CAUD|nr:hypothetical protein FDH93_gp123 [Pseudomonas phage vB_PaeM_G1]ARW57390.1 hypothetical protein vBPaeMG1_123 [Pseudomonas phage vB_PaeM_G1]